MKKELLRKTFAIGIVVLFIGTGIVSAFDVNLEKGSILVNNGNWLYVGGSEPGNYSNIQDAIDNATDGDTVFVYNGMYDLDIWIIVNKSIGLIGENKFNTIINGSGFYINVTKVNLTGFTVQNGIGIMILSDFDVPGNNNVSGNIFKLDDNSTGTGGIAIASGYNTVSDNSFFNCGLWVFSYHNFVYNNTVNGKPLVYLENTSDIIVDDAGQIILVGCNNITIENLQILNTIIGIQLYDTINCLISDNELMNNYFGIILLNSTNNIISGNIILNNSIGLYLVISVNNTISKNSIEKNMFNLFFMNSSYNLFSNNNFKYTYKISNVFSLYSNNKWRGNFWNKPRILPVRIWSYKTTRFRFILLFPYSLDVDWRPAKKPNDINNSGSRWLEFEVNKPRVRVSCDSLFLKIFENLPLFKMIILRIMNLEKFV